MLGEKLVEILKQAPFEGKVLDEWWWEEKIKRITDHLISNGVTVQEWISVNDRLPEPWKQVLIYSRHDFCESAFYIGVPGKWRVTWNHKMLDADSVTHWMPLPQPPKGE